MSSAAPTPTEFMVGLNEKWPDIVIDALVEALPDDSQGELIELGAFDFFIYVTTMSDSLAYFLNEFSPLIPVLEFVSDNEPMPVGDLDGDDSATDESTLAEDSTIHARSSDTAI